MSALHSLGLDAAFENPAILGEGVSLYQWMINRIKSDNLTCSIVTNGLVHDLFCRVHIKKSRHDQHDPKRQFSKTQMCHILCFLICRMTSEEVTQKIERAVWKKIPKEQSPTDLWTGIDFIKKQASGGATTIEEEGDGGGDGGEHHPDAGEEEPPGGRQGDHCAGEGDHDGRLGGGGEVAGQAGETGENIVLLFLNLIIH